MTNYTVNYGRNVTSRKSFGISGEEVEARIGRADTVMHSLSVVD